MADARQGGGVSRVHKFGLKSLFGKKFLVGSGLAIVVAVGGFFVIQGMREQTVAKTAVQNVAEARYFMQRAATPSAEIQFYTGIREENYVQDGIASKAIPFSIINVQLDKKYKSVPELTGTIKIGTEFYEFVLYKNPIDPLNFTNDISKSLRSAINSTDEVEITLLIDAQNTPTVKLSNCMPAGSTTWEDAIRIATESHIKELKGQKFESYATIMYDAKAGNGGFWYVRFVTESGDSHYCVVSNDGKCLV